MKNTTEFKKALSIFTAAMQTEADRAGIPWEAVKADRRLFDECAEVAQAHLLQVANKRPDLFDILVSAR